jgi:hypothetical protein
VQLGLRAVQVSAQLVHLVRVGVGVGVRARARARVRIKVRVRVRVRVGDRGFGRSSCTSRAPSPSEI